MSVQTSYTKYQVEAYEGMIFAQDPHDIFSMSAEGAIGFGKVACRGTDKDSQVTQGGAEADILGIAIRSLEREGAIYSGDISYKDKDTVGVMRKGTLWAVCPTGCAPGDVVNYTTATGVLDSGAPGSGEVAFPNATWDTTTVAGELGRVRLDN